MRAGEQRTQMFRRLTALVVAFALAFSTVAAALTIERLHDHDCTGEECVVCHVLGQARALLQGHAMAPTSQVQLGTGAVLAFVLVLGWWLARAAETPVTMRDLPLI